MNMARFFLSAKNASRSAKEMTYGGRMSIDHAHVRGWDVGIQVECVKLTDGDRLDVYMTGGSHDAGGRTFIGSAVIQRGDSAPHFIAGEMAKLIGEGLNSNR
jgi:aspartate 1-decarboxylase